MRWKIGWGKWHAQINSPTFFLFHESPREWERLEQGIKDKSWGSTREENCYLARDTKTCCSHVIVIFGETVGLPTAVVHPVFSDSNLDWKWNEQTCCFRAEVLCFLLKSSFPFDIPSGEEEKNIFLSRVSQEQQNSVLLWSSLLPAQVLCAFTVQLTGCRDCASHKKHDVHAVWDIVGPLSSLRKQKKSLEWLLL